jgi:hypothetical protein
MTPKVLSDYGGAKVDAVPVSNSQSQVASAEWNRKAEDTAQLTQTAPRAMARFQTTKTAAPVIYNSADVTVRSMWGSGTAQKPTVQKTATGRYTLTWPTTFTDTLSYVETVSFFDGNAAARSTDPLDTIDAKLLTVATNVVTIATRAAGALADVGNSSAAIFTVTVYLF